MGFYSDPLNLIVDMSSNNQDFELLSNLVYGHSLISGGLPADFPFINPVNELYSRDHISQLLEAT